MRHEFKERVRAIADEWLTGEITGHEAMSLIAELAEPAETPQPKPVDDYREEAH
jgi:hypothetical protein